MTKFKNGAEAPSKTLVSKFIGYADANAKNSFKSSVASYSQYLLGRGFSYGDILSKLTECEKEIFDMIDFDAE